MAHNQTEQYNKIKGLYTPSSYHLFKQLVNSAGSANMHGVNITSGTPERYHYVCPSGHNAAINRVNTSIVDGAMTPAKFGGLSALPNGLNIFKYEVDGITVAIDFNDGLPIKKNADWALLVGRDNTISVAAGVGGLPIRWSLWKSGTPLFLGDGESFAFCLQDSTTGIDDFRAEIQGLVYPDTL